MRSYEDSLQRLGMNRIDLLIIHDLDFVSLGSETLVDGISQSRHPGGIRRAERPERRAAESGRLARASTG